MANDPIRHSTLETVFLLRANVSEETSHTLTANGANDTNALRRT